MEEAFLFHNEDISITENVARFGSVSYQVSNIGSVSVMYERKLSGFAIFLFGAGIVAGGLTYLFYQQPGYRDYMLYAAGAAVVLIVLSILWQHMWPVYEYRFTLKTSSGDVHNVISRDRDSVFKLKVALEEAFVRRQMTR